MSKSNKSAYPLLSEDDNLVPYFAGTITKNRPILGSGSVTCLRLANQLNTSSTALCHPDYSNMTKREPYKQRPISHEPIKAWVATRQIAYFDPGTSTYHMVSMVELKDRLWLVTLLPYMSWPIILLGGIIAISKLIE